MTTRRITQVPTQLSRPAERPYFTGTPLKQHASEARARRPRRIAPQALGIHEIAQLAIPAVVAGMVLKDPQRLRVPPSQLATFGAATAVGACLKVLVPLAPAFDPTLTASVVHAVYQAWRTTESPTGRVGLTATQGGGGINHNLMAEFATLAALGDCAARAGTAAGFGNYATTAALLAPALWATARAAVPSAPQGGKPSPLLENMPLQVALGLAATLCITLSAEHLGGSAAAVSASLWTSSQFFYHID